MASDRRNITLKEEHGEWLDEHPGVNLSAAAQHAVDKLMEGEWEIVNGEVREVDN